MFWVLKSILFSANENPIEYYPSVINVDITIFIEMELAKKKREHKKTI